MFLREILFVKNDGENSKWLINLYESWISNRNIYLWKQKFYCFEFISHYYCPCCEPSKFLFFNQHSGRFVWRRIWERSVVFTQNLEINQSYFQWPIINKSFQHLKRYHSVDISVDDSWFKNLSCCHISNNPFEKLNKSWFITLSKSQKVFNLSLFFFLFSPPNEQ